MISFNEVQSVNYEVIITNSLGQIIQQFKASGQNQEVNLNTHSNGVYFVTILSETGNSTVRIIKQ